MTEDKKEKISSEESIEALSAHFQRLFPGGKLGIIERDGAKKLYFSVPQFNVYVEQDLPGEQG